MIEPHAGDSRIAVLPATGVRQIATRRLRSMRASRYGDLGVALLYCAPVLVVFALFTYRPFIHAILLSLFRTNLQGEPPSHGTGWVTSCAFGTLMIPFEATLMPNYLIVSSWVWKDSYPGLIMPFLASRFGVFLMRQNFLSLPRELYDAARRWLRQVALFMVDPAAAVASRPRNAGHLYIPLLVESILLAAADHQQPGMAHYAGRHHDFSQFRVSGL